MPFEFQRTPIEDVVLIKPEVFEDERGYFLETYDESAFDKEGLATEYVLEFYSRSTKRVLRGLHQQTEPYQQGKVVRCFEGEIFDVAVDVRPESATYGEHVSFTLSEKNKCALYIPRGFLHGFQTVSEEAVVHYKVDNEYAPDNERGVRWDDPDLDIDWPFPSPVVSEKDSTWPRLRDSVYDSN